MDIIPRKKYLEQVRPYIGKNLIKVLVGQRRTGKSYFLLSTYFHKYCDLTFL